MTLGDFSSVFEVAVGLNLAFIAAEYASSYTNLLAKYVYKLYDRIEQQFIECKNIVNESSVDALEGNTVDGKKTVSKVEALKIKYEEKKKEIDNKKDEIIGEVNDRCHFRCFAFVSLYLFLYSILALFVSGFQEYEFAGNFWLVFVVSSLLYMVAYSLCVKRGRFKKSTASLSVGIISFSIIAAISLLATFTLLGYNIASYNWFKALVKLNYCISPIIPYINFVVFIFIMRGRSEELYNEAVEIVKNMKPEWEAMKDEVSDLSAVNRVSADLQSTARQKRSTKK